MGKLSISSCCVKKTSKEKKYILYPLCKSKSHLKVLLNSDIKTEDSKKTNPYVELSTANTNESPSDFLTKRWTDLITSP